MLVYFGYGRCSDVCPTTLAALGAVFDRLGGAGARVVVLFVTLDPAHDTAPLLHRYLAAFRPVPVGLTGSPAQIARAAQAWGIHWRARQGGRFLDHSSVVTLMDPEGRLRARYGFGQLARPD